MSEIILPNGTPARAKEDRFVAPPEVKQIHWNIESILKAQKLVDQDYLCKTGLTRGETFKKRKLALWVELGEMVNEWRTIFKYWSKKESARAKILEEYADCLHFLLSLGNDLNIPPYHDTVVKFKDPIDHVFTLSVVISNINGLQSFYDAFALLRGLGDHFGFTNEEIEEAFFKKTEVNKERSDHIKSDDELV